MVQPMRRRLMHSRAWIIQSSICDRRCHFDMSFDALDKFRATMKNPEKFKRYLRVDSESLSMLLVHSRR